MEASRASLYDLRTRAISKDRHAIENLIDTNASVLEVGCGTGRILKWLAERNQMKVIGIEVRRDFMEIARERLSHAENVQLLNTDFMQYQSQSPVDFVLFAFNVIGEFDTASKRVAVLRHAKSMLASNGQIVVIYDLPTGNNYSNEAVQYHFSIGEGDNKWDVLLDCQRDLSTKTSFCKVRYENAAGEVVHDEYCQAEISRDELLGEYAEAGLSIIEEYGSYNLAAFGPDSEVLVHVLG